MKTTIQTVIIVVLLIATEHTISLGKESIATKRANRKASIEAAKNKRTEAIEAAKAKREKIKENMTEKVRNRADKRQDNQSKRIDHGIKKGYLTSDEINKLDVQQKAIESLQQSFMSDGKINKNEAQQLRQELNEASRCIFAEKHDADGNTMPVYRFGNNVTLKNEIAQKLGDENLSKQDASKYLKDFHRMMELKKTLATGNLSDENRTSMQNEYNELLNKYFETK